jgi:biofilm PGA synthesis N-glycosyltransferase PgaC
MISSALLISLLLVFLGIHLLYLLLLGNISQKQNRPFLKNNRTKMYSESDLPIVSILIPVYNEESVITRRIANIFESIYPKGKLQLVVIDSGSSDNTRSEIRSNFQDRVTLVTEAERNGKAHAINLGLEACNGEIVILTDGTALYDKNTILEIVNTFKDTSVGAVSALYRVPNAEDSSVSSSEHKFWLQKDKIRLLESSAHSTSWLSGEACAFRNKIVTRVDEDALADDSNIALQVISKGYRSVVNQEAFFTERSPTQFADYIKIKSRRTLGGLIETLRFKFLLFNPKYGRFGMLIFPYRFFTYIISPILSCLMLMLVVPSTLEIQNLVGAPAVILAIIALTSMGLIGRKTVTVYFYTQLFTVIALLWLVRGNIDVRWTRSSSR